MDSTVEYADSVSVEDRNISCFKVEQVRVVDAPVGVLKEAVALADAFAGALPLLLWSVVAHAAALAVLNGAHGSPRKLKLSTPIPDKLHCRFYMSVVHDVGWTIKEDPSC